MLESYGTNWAEKYENFNFKSYLCPKLDQKLTIGGNYNNEHFFHLKFAVTKCSNKYLESAPWRPTCASENEVNDYFAKNTNVRFLLYTNNYLLNPLNNENYVQNFVEDSLIFSIQKNGAYQTADIFFTEYNVVTDESILPFKSLKNETFLTFESGNFRAQYVVGPIESIFAEFYIRKDNYSFTVNRKFQKISEIISYIGGFSQIFIMIAAIIVHYYNEYIYAISLANKIYDFHFTEQNKQKKVNDIKYQSNGNIRTSQCIISDHNQTPSNKQNNISQQKNKDQKSKIISDNSITLQLEDAEKNKLKNEKKVSKQDKEVKKEDTISPSKGKKKITTREQDGLLPLDKIKTIISQRSSLINNLTSLKTPEKHFDFNFFKSNSSHWPNQNENQIAEEQENHSKISREDQVDILDADSEKQDNKQPFSLSEFGLYQKIQYNTLKIQQKDEQNDSITPETPLARNNLQSPYKQNKKNRSKQQSNVNQNLIQPIQNQSQFSQTKTKQHELQQNHEDILQNQQPQSQNQHEIQNNNQQLLNNQIELIQQQLDQEQQQYQQSKQELLNSKLDSQTQVNGNNNGNNESIVDQKYDGNFDFGISSNHAILRRSTQEQIIQVSQKTPTKKLNEAQQIKKIQDQIDKNLQNKIFEGLGFQNRKQFLTREFEFLLKRDSSIHMTFKYFLYKLTCKKLFRSELVLLLDKAINQMKSDLDIFMIINRLKELEKLKCLFLDKHQEILFNFVPKPVISIKNKQENLSRAEITEQVRCRSDSNTKKAEGKISVKGDQQRKLNINFKTAALVSKAATQFKKPIVEKINEFNNMIAYKKLYEAYERILAQGETQFNKKLIEQLGEEMNKIFEISNMISFKDNVNNPIWNIKQKEIQYINWDSNNSIQKNNDKNMQKQIEQSNRPKNQSLFKINNKSEVFDIETCKKIHLSDDGQYLQEKQLICDKQIKVVDN